MQKRAQNLIEISMLFVLAAVIVMPVISNIGAEQLNFADKIDKILKSATENETLFNQTYTTINDDDNSETAGVISKEETTLIK